MSIVVPSVSVDHHAAAGATAAMSIRVSHIGMRAPKRPQLRLLARTRRTDASRVSDLSSNQTDEFEHCSMLVYARYD